MSKASHFEIQKKTDSGDWVTIDVISALKTSYVVIRSLIGVTQHFRVRAVISGVKQTSLPLNSNYTSDSSILLPEKGRENSFSIERKTGSGSYSEIGIVDKDVTFYRDLSLTDNIYTYRVRALNTTGYSGYSNEVSTIINVNELKVLWTVPFNGINNVPTTLILIKARFDRSNMNTTTINNNTFLVNDGSGNLVPSIPVYFNSDTKDAIFTLGSSTNHLKYPGSYTMTLKASISDLNGNTLGTDRVYKFTTTNNYLPPKVNWVAPMNNQVDIDRKTVGVLARFDRYYMEPRSFLGSNFVVNSSKKKIMATAIDFDITSGIATFSFPADDYGYTLDPLEVYTVVLGSGISDMLGGTLGKDFSFKFTTGSFFPASSSIDILSLFPEKYRTAPVIQDLVSVMNDRLTSYLNLIKELKYNQDPWLVPTKYVNNLAKFIGLDLFGIDNVLGPLKNQILDAVSWYKIKGTYLSIRLLLYWTGFDSYFLEYYVSYNPNIAQNDKVNYNNIDDYIGVVKWFVGDETTGKINPKELNDPNLIYFKSPHFGIVVKLDKLFLDENSTVFGAEKFGLGIFGGYYYLWTEKKYNSFFPFIDKTIPVNTIPHYLLLLAPTAKNDGLPLEFPKNTFIWTRVYSNWTLKTLYFDMNPPWNFDDGVSHFDFTFSAFLKSFDHWELGSGNKNVVPANDFEIKDKRLDGNILRYEINPEMPDGTTFSGVRFDAEVPQDAVYTDLSEFAIYSNYFTPLRKVEVGSTFPSITLHKGVQLIISTYISFI